MRVRVKRMVTLLAIGLVAGTTAPERAKLSGLVQEEVPYPE